MVEKKAKNKEKSNEKGDTQESKKESSQKTKPNNQESILKNVLIIGGIIILIVVGLYIYTQNQNSYSYKEIEFKKALIGDLTFYETVTLAEGPNGEEFGFRLRTNPKELKTVSFKEEDKLTLMKINVIGIEDESNSFKCEGEGVIAIANLDRLLKEMGSSLAKDENSSCDPEGRYNYFNLKYGDKNSIEEVGNKCYDLVIKGNDNKCDILPVTEKLMVELYSKYLKL